MDLKGVAGDDDSNPAMSTHRCQTFLPRYIFLPQSYRAALALASDRLNITKFAPACRYESDFSTGYFPALTFKEQDGRNDFLNLVRRLT